jgi:putative ABC transport system permease protein
MLESPWARLLARLLPVSTRRDLFEPARQDLRIARLLDRDRTHTTLARAARSFWTAAKTILLFLECWGIVLQEALSIRRPARATRVVTHAPPTERLPMFFNDFRHAFRMLSREPGFTLAALLTLALGVGGNVAVFAVVEAVLLRPLPYPDAGRLVILHHRDQRTGITKEFIAIGDYVDIARRQSAFESVAGYGDTHATIFGLGEPFRADGLVASPDLLETLGARPVLGRSLRAEDARQGAAPVMLLGYDLWSGRFGSDPNIVGRGVRIQQQEVQVVGVAPPGFHFPPNARTDVILPMTVPPQAPSQRKSDWTFAVARLKPNLSLPAAAANLATISRQLQQEFPRDNAASEYFAVSLRDALVGNTKPALLLMLGAVGVLLLIACVNVANLLLARSVARRREMAVRVALGAGRARLIAQLVTESLALAMAAGALGILIAFWGSRALVALVPKSVSVPGLSDVHINAGVLAFALGISAATALVFGLLSAFAVHTESATGMLVAPGRVSAGSSVRRTASALVVAQVALAIVLLIGAGLILRSFSRLVTVDPGFHTDRVMTMSVSFPADRYKEVAARQALFQRSFAALKGMADVQEAGAAVVVPLTGNNWTVPFERVEQPVPAGQRPPEVGWQMASGGYFRTLQIPLLAGRLFDERDGPNTKQVVIVSDAIRQRYFPNENPVGREVKVGNQKMEIVGLVGSIRRAGLRDSPHADMYFPFESWYPNSITLFVRTGADPRNVLPLMQSALRSIEPNVTLIEANTMSEILSESVQVTHLALWLLGVFAATALALAAVGIYGVMSYVVRQRTREIGTRVALGATRSDIVWLVMRQGAGITILGITIGLVTGLVAARMLGSMLFETSASDPITLGLAAIVLAATTMAACYLPARRAAQVDPARTLAEQ